LRNEFFGADRFQRQTGIDWQNGQADRTSTPAQVSRPSGKRAAEQFAAAPIFPLVIPGHRGAMSPESIATEARVDGSGHAGRQNSVRWLWIPGSALARRPGMTAEGVTSSVFGDLAACLLCTSGQVRVSLNRNLACLAFAEVLARLAVAWAFCL
jgi:hypothetical protein